MPIAIGTEVRKLLGVGNLHLSGTAVEARAAKSAEHAQACCRLLTNASMSGVDKNNLTTLITDVLAPGGLWQPADLSAIVQAIEASAMKKKR